MVDVFAPDGRHGEIPANRLADAMKAGFKRAYEMTAPDGQVGYIPQDRLMDAQKAGFKLAGAGAGTHIAGHNSAGQPIFAPDEVQGHPTDYGFTPGNILHNVGTGLEQLGQGAVQGFSDIGGVVLPQALGGEGLWNTVVGVADNVKNGGLVEPDEPEIYFLRKSIASDWSGRAPLMIVDSVLSPKAAIPWVRSQIAQLDPTVPVTTETMNDQISNLANRPRFEMALLGFFAFCGLLMAMVGLYGVISFLAMQRTQEIGVRMAMGATRLNVLRLILAEGVRLIVAGGVIGLTISFATVQLLKSLLYEVKPHDPAIYAVAMALLVLVALAATLIPARAAMKVEPTVALRYE